MKQNIIFFAVFVLSISLSKESFAQSITQRSLRESRVLTNFRTSPTSNPVPTVVPMNRYYNFPTLENYIYNSRSQIIRPTPGPLIIDDNSKPPYLSQMYVNMAVNDLADRLGVNSDQITVVSITLKDFGDSSLGCPQPGYFYIQVITPGYIIVLSHGGTTYTYHGGLNSVVHC